MGLLPERYRCCGKLVCHCNTPSGSEETVWRERVVKGNGKEVKNSNGFTGFSVQNTKRKRS